MRQNHSNAATVALETDFQSSASSVSNSSLFGLYFGHWDLKRRLCAFAGKFLDVVLIPNAG